MRADSRFKTPADLVTALKADPAGVTVAFPIWKELGIASVSSNWRSLVGPKVMTEDQINYWDQVIGKLARLPEWREELEKNLIEPTYLDARNTKNRMETEYAELSKLLGELGLARQ